MAGKQRPRVAVLGVGSIAAGGGLVPYCVGDQFGKQPIELFVFPSVQPDETRSAQHSRILVEKIAGHEVDELAVGHGVRRMR